MKNKIQGNRSAFLTARDYAEPARTDGLFSRLFGSNGGNGNGRKRSRVAVETIEGLRGCLDNQATNVFVADAEFNLIYMNSKAEATVKDIAEEIREVFHVDVEDLVGGSIHRFHRDPKSVERILRNPSALPHTAEFGFGNVALRANINAVYGPEGETLGYIVNWEEISNQKRAEAERARIVSMMDNAPINMMFADRDFNLRYMNPASFNTLKTLEQYLPEKVDRLMGRSIDIFHKNPGQVRKLLSDSRNLPHKARIQVGPEVLDLLVSATYGQDNDYLGPMVSWEVVTERLELQRKADELAERERVQAEEMKRKVDALLPVVNAVAEGDLTRQVTVAGEDALGRIGSGLSRLVSDLRGNISAIAFHAQELAASSRQISSVSQMVSANAEETAAQSNVVSAASEQVNASAQTVATGAEEMSASIKDIALNATEAARVAGSAVKIAEEAGRTVSQLGESSSQIGQVLKVITSIAEQTNLLALNATIEAARAGEAGKGFAVVASEVKDLAKGTAKATEDIGKRIQAIQTDTQSATGAIARISEVINRINDISSTIASAVEEQTATTNEMTRNIGAMARSSAEISGNIAGVAKAAQSTTEGVGDARKAAVDLDRMAGELQGLVGRFKLKDESTKPAV